MKDDVDMSKQTFIRLYKYWLNLDEIKEFKDDNDCPIGYIDTDDDNLFGQPVKLNTLDIVLLCELYSRCITDKDHKCWPTNEQLCKLIGDKRGNIQKRLVRLRTLKFITIENKFTGYHHTDRKITVNENEINKQLQKNGYNPNDYAFGIIKQIGKHSDNSFENDDDYGAGGVDPSMYGLDVAAR